MRPRPVAMRLLVAADRNLRDMRMHGSVRHCEGDIFRSLAAAFEIVKFEAAQIGDEVRFPGMRNGARIAAIEDFVFAVALEVLLLANPLGKGEGIVEDEIEIV